MNFDYIYPSTINLFVQGRISEDDAARQARTVKAILQKLRDQPGVILADEVGMGKTFVALGVAISVYIKEKRPSVVMIPRNLINKWPSDFRLFCESCITDPILKKQLRCGIAEKPEQFLKLLDDEEGKRATIIFLTHGALARKMSDSWVKLAIMQKALYRRRNTEELYKLLYKYAGSLIGKEEINNKLNENDIWISLINNSPEKWKKILVRNGILGPEDDDPVPLSFLNELNKVRSQDMDDLYNTLCDLPKRNSSKLKDRLGEIRSSLRTEAKKIWARCLSKIKLDLPLLIFDEAHHLKNSQTQLVTKLFHEPEAEEDAGILARQFDRMLFLTATPFQLGHHELLNVLERFGTINWSSSYAPPMVPSDYKQELTDLLKMLDQSQIVARKLDLSWGKLQREDLVVNEQLFDDVYEWWRAMQLANLGELPLIVQKIKSDFQLAKAKLQIVEPLLRKYVIRHLKPRLMGAPYKGIHRRRNLPGNCIIDETFDSGDSAIGLSITKHAILPFLLAARLTAIRQDQRPVFAEGLASSFEAFRFTHDERKRVAAKQTDIDDEPFVIEKELDPVTSWYLEQLDGALSLSNNNANLHPKLKPTIDKTIELWAKGEKVLIFCHYIATGKALRKYLSREMRMHIRKEGAIKLNCSEDDVFDELDKIANRISKPESPLHKRSLHILNSLIDQFSELESSRQDIIEAMLRYMKTPSFLVRFAVESDETNEDWLEQSFNTKDNSGISLKEMLLTFLHFLENRAEDRIDYISALRSIQPGGIKAADVSAAFENDEMPDESETTVMANVRLCYGATKPETRQRLMKTFNTPFFPDILITSSVMAEGVDLHLNCRHIIHHDLSWNPSTLEQRTGRVDRIGAKSERCGQPIKVYLPYLSETQDEKMYRVVTERERWFNIIMGEKYKVDAINTDKYAVRIPLPEELAKELTFKLEIGLSE